MKWTILSTLAFAKVYFKETFDNGMDRWITSEIRDDYGKWTVSPGNFYADELSSRALKTTLGHRFYAISAQFDELFDHKDKDFVIQYSVKFEQNIDCGGGYLKILPPGFDPKKFDGDTPYNIMFGPDICGNDKKTHAILNYKDKNHLIKKPIQCESDQMTHLYTFIIKPDQTYKVLVDQEEKSSGSILKNWELLPVDKIDDPNASKPSSWVDNPMMDDPTDVKPDGWDAPDTITDPEALKPEDWDDEDDGEWEPAVLPNPDYKGEWKPKQIKNPDYKGKWVHPKIDNPAYNYDANIYAYKSQYVGFDLWQVKAGTMFDNIIITDSLEEANQFASLTFTKDKPLEKKAKEALDKEEEERIEKERLENEIKREKESKDTSKDDITVVPPIEQEIKDEEHGEL